MFYLNEIHYYDSLEGSKEIANKYLNTLLIYLSKVQQENFLVHIEKWKLIYKKHPNHRQTNDYDCGNYF